MFVSPTTGNKEKIDYYSLLTGTVHRLEKGKNVSTRPIVKALAEMLIYLTKC